MGCGCGGKLGEIFKILRINPTIYYPYSSFTLYLIGPLLELKTHTPLF